MAVMRNIYLDFDVMAISFPLCWTSCCVMTYRLKLYSTVYTNNADFVITHYMFRPYTVVFRCNILNIKNYWNNML
jgi:hypothetical protein